MLCPLAKYFLFLGDGLGAQNQGIVDPITLKANQDQKGVGHQGGDHDVWLNHKDNFDDVLASLNR